MLSKRRPAALVEYRAIILLVVRLNGVTSKSKGEANEFKLIKMITSDGGD